MGKVIEGNPEYWRRRALKARILAEHMDDLSKSLMLTVAMDYERIARAVEARNGKASKLRWHHVNKKTRRDGPGLR